MDLFALTVGIIIHDLSKGSIRKMEEKYSHSQMMLKKPEYITKETEKVLKEIEEKVGAELKYYSYSSISSWEMGKNST